MTSLYPFRFQPVYKDYLWGGTKLGDILGRRLEPGKIYAESWEVADLEEGKSVVAEGSLAGTSLHQLVVDRGGELLGRHHPQSRFPLLLKYLDARNRLSVQVHPDDHLAARMGLSDPGKTEAWVVLQADPGSPIWAGFNQPVDRQTLQQAVCQGNLERYLHRFEPVVGECLFLPAGTVHALGEGLMVAEIQQSSNNTFRLFDWNRTGPDGKPRTLHVAEALEAIDYTQAAIRPQRPRATASAHVERLVHCDKFVLDRWTLSCPRPAGGDDRCHILTVVQGSLSVEGDPSGRPLACGRTVVLPAAAGLVGLTPLGDAPAVVLDAYPP